MNLIPKKSLGQNFLNDKKILNKIVESGEICEKDSVLEIGPGTGNLTEIILSKKPKKLIVVEKDKELSLKLSKKFKNNIEIINTDILDYFDKLKFKEPLKVFGNLPYNISSQILVNFIRFKKWPPNFTDLIFMFQKELAEKITGQFSEKNYGRLSILNSFRFKVSKKFLVSPNCFVPKPKVYSSVLHFKPKKKLGFKIKNITTLEKVTHTFFSNKRKIIRKNIIKLLNSEKIKLLKEIDLTKRPSEIKPEIYYKISELLERK